MSLLFLGLAACYDAPRDNPLDPALTPAVVWDGADAVGRAVASGVYVYRLEVVGQGVVETKRMALVR